MTDSIKGIREHVLWNVSWHLQDLTTKADSYEQKQRSWGGLGIRQAWASVRLAQLRPNILWWSEIKMAIESDEPNRALPALERLIRHYRPSKFFLTWIGLLSQSYWDMGMGLIAKAAVSENIREATVLQEYYQQQAA